MSQERYIQTGVGDVVLMLHSSMSSKSQWKGLMTQLSSTHRVIAIDLLGYGNAPFPSQRESYSLKSEIAQIDRVLDELDIAEETTVHVIGHSFGGATALRWAYEHPLKVKSLHLFEPVAFHLLEAPCEGLSQILGVIDGLYEDLKNGNKVRLCQAFIDYWSGQGAFDSFPPNVQQAMIAQVDKVILDFEALLTEPLSLSDYASFSFPITLIMGKRSPISSQTISHKLKDTLRHLTFHQVDCGHMGPITHSDLVNEIWVKEIGKTISEN
ncbi:alpha/beta fold hydrolase [Terasakiella sp.]|uniref:alpha/beta fold hydrolase n=1 Tax=Terasakiella sp. TaxID=2034861 RepID=UPI003AA9521A